ncbi:hypothetical protein [Phenylobacterium sp.]|uniref:hypothetical protein n=1 Tax=Phenylobacterium sp. TaxID=1871053 RepID=UPI00301D6BB5
MTAAAVAGRPRARSIWLVVGLLLLAYAVAGNWLVLPGYRRFLAHGSPGDGGSGVDLALIWGAARTILWMLSFHLGAFCVAWAAIGASGASRAFRRGFALGAAAWIGLWTIPTLPGPYTAVFASLGVLILVLMAAAFARAALTGEPFADARGAPWRIASAFFFALATWDICGLGSVGGILRPDSAERLANHALVVAQTTKLIVELVIAWALLAAAAFPARGGRPA